MHSIVCNCDTPGCVTENVSHWHWFPIWQVHHAPVGDGWARTGSRSEGTSVARSLVKRPRLHLGFLMQLAPPLVPPRCRPLLPEHPVSTPRTSCRGSLPGAPPEPSSLRQRDRRQPGRPCRGTIRPVSDLRTTGCSTSRGVSGEGWLVLLLFGLVCVVRRPT